METFAREHRQAVENHGEHRAAVIIGCVLAFLSAGVNACYVTGIGTSVSHLTGDVSKVALDITLSSDALSTALVRLIAATLGFVGGAMTAGFLIHHPVMSFSRPYGRSLVGIGCCLLLAQSMLKGSPALSVMLAGAACGFQNALATHYRGMVLRTTHVTGILTDLGSSLGMLLRGHRMASWKLWVPACLVSAFFLGSVAGCAAFITLGMTAMLFYSVAYMLLGAGWGCHKHSFLAGKQPQPPP